MHSISRRRFVRTLAGVPFLMAAPWRAFAASQSGSLRGSQIEAVEVILRRLVDSGTVPGISYSIGNTTETLTEGAFGLRQYAAE